LKYIERNFEIIKASMMDTMETSVALGRKLIDTELDAGIFNFIVKPIVKAFYSYWSSTDVRKGTIQQIDVTLNCGKLLLQNGHSQDNFDKIIEDNFHIYLKGDQTSRNCKKRHKNYPQLVQITKDSFVDQVRDSARYLDVDKEDAISYDELSREVFKTKQEAYASLIKMLDFNEAGIKIVEKDPTILTVPTGRNVIVRVLRKGFDMTKKELVESLDKVFKS